MKILWSWEPHNTSLIENQSLRDSLSWCVTEMSYSDSINAAKIQICTYDASRTIENILPTRQSTNTHQNQQSRSVSTSPAISIICPSTAPLDCDWWRSPIRSPTSSPWLWLMEDSPPLDLFPRPLDLDIPPLDLPPFRPFGHLDLFDLVWLMEYDCVHKNNYEF